VKEENPMSPKSNVNNKEESFNNVEEKEDIFMSKLKDEGVKLLDEFGVEFKDVLGKYVEKEIPTIIVRDLFPNFDRGSNQHKFLQNLRSNNIARTDKGRPWSKERTIIFSSKGVDIANSCGLKLKQLVFFSYSHNDYEWLERVRKHFGVLYHDTFLEPWDDRDLKPGTNWKEEIQLALERARATVLLISPDFLNSDFIRDGEIRKILEIKSKSAELKYEIFPIIVWPCAWRVLPWLADTQVTPANGKTLGDLSPIECDHILAKVAEDIADVLGVNRS
jgi:hypothetical protein